MTALPSVRSGKVTQLAVLVLLAGSGLAAGYLIPWNDDSLLPDGVHPSPKSPELLTPIGSEFRGSTTHHFPLSSLDVRDHNQAPQVVSDGGSTLWLAWDSRTDEQTYSLFLTRSDDGGQTFQKPRVIRQVPIREWEIPSRGRVMKRSSRLWPHLAWVEGTLYLNWLGPDGDDEELLTLFVSRSTDGGDTFDAPTPLSTPIAARRGYTGFAVGPQGGVATCWLDSRHGSQQPFASLLVDGRLDEQLVFAGAEGKGICPCCTLDVLIGDDGTQYVAFRNQVDGYRDMWLAVRGPRDTEFTAPVPTVEPRWEFNGCPHDGPTMVIQGNRLHMTWMDAHTGIQQVYHGQATIGEWQFEVRPIHASPAVQGHAYVAVEGDVLRIVWEEASGTPAPRRGLADENESRLARTPSRGAPSQQREEHAHGSESPGASTIFMVTSDDGGVRFGDPVQVSDETDTFCSRPLTLRSGERLVTAWTSLSEQGKQIVIKSDSAPSPANTLNQVATDE